MSWITQRIVSQTQRDILALYRDGPLAPHFSLKFFQGPHKKPQNSHAFRMRHSLHVQSYLNHLEQIIFNGAKVFTNPVSCG